MAGSVLNVRFARIPLRHPGEPVARAEFHTPEITATSEPERNIPELLRFPGTPFPDACASGLRPDSGREVRQPPSGLLPACSDRSSSPRRKGWAPEAHAGV